MKGAVPSYSGPIVFVNKSCLTINNGLINFATPKIGLFNSSCFLDLPFIPTNVTWKVYPNPVVTNFTIKANNVSSIYKIPVWLELISIDGKIISTQLTDIETLSNGYIMNASQLISGTYIIKILSINQLITTHKIIKIK